MRIGLNYNEFRYCKKTINNKFHLRIHVYLIKWIFFLPSDIKKCSLFHSFNNVPIQSILITIIEYLPVPHPARSYIECNKISRRLIPCELVRPHSDTLPFNSSRKRYHTRHFSSLVSQRECECVRLFNAAREIFWFSACAPPWFLPLYLPFS